MTLDLITDYVHNYGYIVIFVVLFMAVIGIPAPEETLMLLIGGMLMDSGLQFFAVIAIALFAVNSAMLVSYFAGRRLGNRLVIRYGHKINLTPAKWDKLKKKLEKYDGKKMIFTYFLPGMRQLVPYLSGTRKVSYPVFLGFTFTGSLLWTLCYTTIGYYLGDVLGPALLAVFALGICLLFPVIVVIKRIVKARPNERNLAHK